MNSFCPSVEIYIIEIYYRQIQILLISFLKHSPKGHKIHKISNRNNLEVSCNNQMVVHEKAYVDQTRCNCRDKDKWTTIGKATSPVYEATISFNEPNYTSMK